MPPSYLSVTPLKLCNLLMTSDDLNLKVEVEVGKDERVGVKVEMEVAVGESESG